MSMLRRVLLLLSVAALFREGSSGSLLDSLRDFKNRIFTFSDTSELTENSSAQCSGLDQDGVCILQKTTDSKTLHESNITNHADIFEKTYINNVTKESNMLEMGQFGENEIAVEDIYNTNNTQYYDEQDWNNTSINNTDNYSHDFEYPENGQNGTVMNIKSSVSSGDGNHNQIDQSKNPTENFTKNNPPYDSGDEQINLKATENNISSTQNEFKTTDLVKNAEWNNTAFMTEVATNERHGGTINDGQKTSESTKTTLYKPRNIPISDSYHTLRNYSELQNKIEDVKKNQSFVENKTYVAIEDTTDSQNTYLSLGKDINGANPKKIEREETNENSTHENKTHTTITRLKDILDNSTWIIKNMVQNIVPAISNKSYETEENENNDTTHDHSKKEKTTEDIILNSTDTDSDKHHYEQLNYTTVLTDRIGNENSIATVSTLSEPFNNEIQNISGTSNVTELQPSEVNLKFSTASENNNADKVKTNTSTNFNITFENSPNLRRDKRSINFTILTGDDEEEQDLSVLTIPDSAAKLSSSTTLQSTESSSWNGTQQAIEVVGPICIKQYEQCTNSSQCCEEYECISKDDNIAISYCDLRPMNSMQSTSSDSVNITDELQ